MPLHCVHTQKTLCEWLEFRETSLEQNVYSFVTLVRVWPRGQASLGSPEPPLPSDGHARPSSIEDHLNRDREYFKDRIL
jgi:hypothetical protein